MIYIGIDPDTDKSGVAVFDTEDNSLELSTLSFWDLIEELDSYIAPIHIVIEGGHLINKSNWHGSKNIYTAAKIGKNVGSNHAIGRLLVEYCEKHGLSYETQKPKGKVSAEYFKAITGYAKRTNQEERDAAMLVYGRKKLFFEK